MFCMRAVGRTRVFWRLQCSFLAVISVIKSNDRALSKTKMTAFWKKLSWNSSIAAVKYSHYRVRSDDPQSMAMGEKRSEGKLCASLYSYSIHEVLSLRCSHEQSPAASARKKRDLIQSECHARMGCFRFIEEYHGFGFAHAYAGRGESLFHLILLTMNDIGNKKFYFRIDFGSKTSFAPILGLVQVRAVISRW